MSEQSFSLLDILCSYSEEHEHCLDSDNSDAELDFSED